jgi:hypothetical protein
MLTGSCFCGLVRYQAPEPLYRPTLCHCRSCRRACGAHAVGWFTVLEDRIVYLQGKPVERQSSDGVWRGYCGQCHSPMTYRNAERAAEVDVTIASLDDPDLLEPADHIHMGQAVGWLASVSGKSRAANLSFQREGREVC